MVEVASRRLDFQIDQEFERVERASREVRSRPSSARSGGRFEDVTMRRLYKAASSLQEVLPLCMLCIRGHYILASDTKTAVAAVVVPNGEVLGSRLLLYRVCDLMFSEMMEIALTCCLRRRLKTWSPSLRRALSSITSCCDVFKGYRGPQLGQRCCYQRYESQNVANSGWKYYQTRCKAILQKKKYKPQMSSLGALPRV